MADWLDLPFDDEPAPQVPPRALTVSEVTSGIRDLLEPDAILLIEWPERAGEAALPTVDLDVRISYADTRSAGSGTLAPTQKIIPERAASTREEKAVVAAGAENSCGARRVLLHPVTAKGKSLANSVQSSWPRDK